MTVRQIQHRRDTASNWTSVNPILANGEIGFETDTRKYKLGDGGTVWNSLEYYGILPDQSGNSGKFLTTNGSAAYWDSLDLSSASAAAVAAIVDSAPATLDTLNELAAALNDDANFASTVAAALSNKLDASSASTTYATISYVDTQTAEFLQNNQTGTTYTFVLADADRIVTASNASPVTFTIPPSASVAWVDNSILRIANYGAGALSVAGGSGVTVTNSSTTLLQYQSGVIVRTAENVWTLLPFAGGASPLSDSSVTGTTGSPATATYSSGGINYKTYTFTGTGSITVNRSGLVDVLVVSGGGSSSSGYAAGGGGTVISQTISLPSGSSTVTIGAGASSTGSGLVGRQGNPSGIGIGTNTYLIIGIGGGGSGSDNGATINGQAGGTGGGGSSNGGTSSGGTAFISSLGGNGGGGAANAGGGGGGAGGNGTSGAGGAAGGNGGAGVASTLRNGSSVSYGGGGAGAGLPPGTATAGGGAGGSGAGNGTDGSANTGGGAGGRQSTGHNGGSGIVIIRVRA